MTEQRHKLIRTTTQCKELFDKLKERYETVHGPATQTHFLNVLLRDHQQIMEIQGK